MPQQPNNFTVNQAYTVRCDECREIYIGGIPDDDEGTKSFMERHAHWHQNIGSGRPTKSLIIP